MRLSAQRAPRPFLHVQSGSPGRTRLRLSQLCLESSLSQVHGIRRTLPPCWCGLRGSVALDLVTLSVWTWTGRPHGSVSALPERQPPQPSPPSCVRPSPGVSSVPRCESGVGVARADEHSVHCRPSVTVTAAGPHLPRYFHVHYRLQVSPLFSLVLPCFASIFPYSVSR